MRHWGLSGPRKNFVYKTKNWSNEKILSGPEGQLPLTLYKKKKILVFSPCTYGVWGHFYRKNFHGFPSCCHRDKPREREGVTTPLLIIKKKLARNLCSIQDSSHTQWGWHLKKLKNPILIWLKDPTMFSQYKWKCISQGLQNNYS